MLPSPDVAAAVESDKDMKVIKASVILTCLKRRETLGLGLLRVK